MSFQLRLLNRLIRLFAAIQKGSTDALHQLKFMKYQMEFGERDDDIYVASYMKSGTTWMQMILYQLTTAGDMNFRHIYDVSPWPRQHANRNETVKQLPAPRIIKTHDPYHKIRKDTKGRFVYLIRDGRDVAVSLWHHRLNYNNSRLTFEDNFRMSFTDRGMMNWFEHVKHWLENRNRHMILYVRYEDLQKNFDEEIERIAGFIGVELKPENLARIRERSSFQFMKQHQEKFGEQPPENKQPIVYDRFLRSGKTGEGVSVMSSEQLQIYTARWQHFFAQSDVMKPYTERTSVS